MASEKQLDKLEQAWKNMRKRVNDAIPDATARVRAARNKLAGQAMPGDSGV
jgi:hypothetical protein